MERLHFPLVFFSDSPAQCSYHAGLRNKFPKPQSEVRTISYMHVFEKFETTVTLVHNQHCSILISIECAMLVLGGKCNDYKLGT